jgi:cytochrome c biogenesis protein CcmG/thiol:disulfide interchange protein DsbE
LPGFMTFRILLAVVFITVEGNVLAADRHFDLLKVGNEVYTNVTVTSVSATEILFTHSRGLGSAKLKNLDPALQKLFAYDPAKAAAREGDQAKANAIYSQMAREAPPPAVAPQTTADESDSEVPPEVSPGNGIPPHPLKAKSFLNQAAPELQVEKWLTPPPDTNGKFVLLDFWATWCGPCRHSIPELNAFQAKFGDRLVVIGLSNESEQAVRRMTSPQIDYSVAIDTQHRTKSEVHVTAIPHTMLIDPKGIVRFEGNPGYLNERRLEMLLTRFSR